MSSMEALFASVSWELAAIGVAVMAAILAMAAGAQALLATPRSVVLDRIDRVVGQAQAAGARAPREEKGGGLFALLTRPFLALVRPTRSDEVSRLRGRLIQAGLRSERAMELFLFSKLVLAGLATVAFLQINERLARGLVFPTQAFAAIAICAIGFFLPNLWLNAATKKRQAAIERGLPDAMDLLVTCVEAGLGLDAAMARVADELKLAAPILSAEINTTCLEVSAGITRREALRRLAERTGVEDLRQLSAVLAQTEVFGTSIARALRVHADGMRVRRMQAAEKKAAMVGVKMTFPLILCILPALVSVVLGPAIVSIFTKIINRGS